MSLETIFDIAGSGMSVQSIRLNVAASNMSNAENIGKTPGETYHARVPIFAAISDQEMAFADQSNAPKAGVKVIDIIESKTPLRHEYQPGNPMADKEGYVNLPNVNSLEEMTNVISASRDYQRNVQVMITARNLMQQTIHLAD